MPEGLLVRGVILADQARSVDWRGQQAEYIGCVSGGALDHVVAKLAVLVGFRA